MASDPRVQVNFRVAPSRRDWLDEVAKGHRVDRAVVIRAALVLAARQPMAFGQVIDEIAEAR